MAADATAAKINQIGGGVLRRPRRAAPLPSEGWLNFEDVAREGLDVEEKEDLAMGLM